MGTLALPSYGILIDVYHENKLDEVILIETTGSPTTILTLIVWEDVSTTDQRALIRVFEQYESSPPSDGLSPGRQTVSLKTSQFVGSPHPTGLRGGKQYTVTVDVTGPGSPNSITSQTATIQGSNAQTFPQLASALTSALNDVDVVFLGNTLRFSTTASGSNAKVEIGRLGTLFNPASPLLGFNGFSKPRVGVSTVREILELNRTGANVLFSDKYSFINRKRRPYLNQPSQLRTQYFDSGSSPIGSPLEGEWRFLGTDLPVGSPNVTPPWLLPN